MRVVESTRVEIEKKIAPMGDYVKMEYLSQCLKQSIDFDTRKFVLSKLAALYESRGMFLEAGKLVRNAADIHTNFQAKINEFVKSGELFVKAGNYDEADISFRRALSDATPLQRKEIKDKIKKIYISQAKSYGTKDKRKHAMKVYEKLLTLDINLTERKEVQTTLMQIYENLGKIKEFYAMKRALENPQPIKMKESEERERFGEEEINTFLRR
ncbi:MAG: hypothetical protein Q7S74_03835 [Nanoarchaeota archaeon]|nr:hypothetical protein [Nanoarchaeota archaeon]